MSLADKVRKFLWREDTTWRDLIIIVALLVVVIALIRIAA